MEWKNWGKKALVPALGLAVLAAGIPAAMAQDHHEQKEGGQTDGVSVKSVEFAGMAAPSTAQEMAQLYTTASIKVTYTDGYVKSFPLEYKKLFKSTDNIGGTVAGVAVDSQGKPVMDTTDPAKPVPYVSEDPDSNSLLSVSGMKAAGNGNPLSLVTHYEYINRAYGLVPASMSLTTIDQNKATGELKPVSLKKIDFSGVDGLWIPCNGSLTPWNTHLGSEEYEPDARVFETDPTKANVAAFTKNYYGDATKKGNPYLYGFLPEVTVNADNTTSVVKHYSLGRFSHELGRVAPDRKTVLFGDDGGNTMLFLYAADKAEDLSAGTLYAAKWVQKTAEKGGSADLQWMKLGHSTDNEIKAFVDKGIKFSDMFETSDKAAEGFTAVKLYSNVSTKVEYLKVKPGMEKAAAFLESRRYGAVLGATAEFNKMEGVAFDGKNKKAYVAMSYVQGSMEKDAKGADPADDIQVNKIGAGVTYELSMNGNQKDSAGASIDSEYVPSFMQGLVVGEDLAAPDALGNKAAADKVANPDNLSFSEELRTLFIGEDSGMHTNNFVWAYNVDTKQLSRILSTPAGAEATGLTSVDNLNGFSYLMSNIQHPGEDILVPASMKADVQKYLNQNYDNLASGVVGYVSGVPTMQQMLAAKAEESKMIPLRDAAEQAGAQLFVSFDKKDILVLQGSHTLVIRAGNQTAKIDGKSVVLPAVPVIQKNRLMVPASVLSDFLQP